MAKSMLGIDIGAGYLKLALVDADNRLVQVAYERMPENLVRNGRMVSFEAMADFLKETVQKNKIAAKDCAVALSGADTFVRRVEIPAMTVSQLELNLPFEFKDYLETDQAKYKFDYAVLDTKYDEAGTPTQLDLLAVAAPKERIAQYAAMLKRAGLRLKVATPAIMAFVKAVRMYEDTHGTAAQGAAAVAAAGAVGAEGDAGATGTSKPLDYCFADIGTASTKVHLFPQGKYDMTRSMEFGRNSLIDAVAEYYGKSPVVAESYFDQNLEGAQDIEACRDLYERAGVELSRVVNFFNYNYRDSDLRQVFYTGAAANAAPLMEVIASHLSTDLVSIGAVLPEALRPQSDMDLNMCFTAICVAAR